MTVSDTYYACQNSTLEDSYYCQVVNLVGKMPTSNSYMYDISFLFFFVCLLAVICSPVYFLYRIIRGVKHE